MSRVNEAVRSLRDFLEAHGEVGWGEHLRGIERELASAETHTQAVAKLRESFGGMGSLNDISFDIHGGDPSANRWLAKLLDICYREAVLDDQTWAGRALWFALSFANLGGIPPRIRRAFR